jgi:hypothetical protein
VRVLHPVLMLKLHHYFILISCFFGNEAASSHFD